MLLKILFVGLGGLSGAISRYLLSSWIKDRFQSSFPYGTLTVNLVGCFLFGLIFYGLERKQGLAPHVKELILIGFLGSFTTFSTFGYETLEMLEKGRVFFGHNQYCRPYSAGCWGGLCGPAGGSMVAVNGFGFHLLFPVPACFKSATAWAEP